MIKALRRSPVVLAAALALAAAALAQDKSLLDVNAAQAGETRDGGKQAPALISLESTGGYRWSKTERLSVALEKDKASITIERIPYGKKQPPQGPTTFPITQAQYDALVGVLEANDAANLKDDDSIKRKGVTDFSDYTVTVTLKGKTSTFHVYGPQMMHDAHTRVIDALENLSWKVLPSPQM